jgi:hypothetical protein
LERADWLSVLEKSSRVRASLFVTGSSASPITLSNI